MIYAGEKKLRLYYGSFLTWSAWTRVANLLAQTAPSAEFDAMAQQMRDGDIGEAGNFITLGWVVLALIVGSGVLITLK